MTRALLLLTFLAATVHAEKISLAENGRALLPIVISDHANDDTRRAAAELAGVLKRISGAEFALGTKSEARGIVLGTAKDFPGFIEPNDAITAREDYRLRSEPGRLLLIGQTPAAVEHAMWDLLHRLGYRQFFPGQTWEIVPPLSSLSIDIDVTVSPNYHARRIWFGFGALKEREAVYDEWCRRNRATSGIALNSGHSYLAMMSRHQGEFAQHPEYLALVGGRRQGPKFCIANIGLRKLFVDDALAQIVRNPSLDSISCDPSDGGGWCECADCARIGSISDRALLLANEVAAAVNAQKPGRLVGMYAYSQHSPPPTIQAHPQVVISVATSFIRGGYTVEQLLAGWHAKARTLGIREYFGVNIWDRDLPGAARGGNIDYLRTTIPQFRQAGVRFMSAESSDNFGPNGLGYYLAARILWDVNEAKNIEALTADFLEKAFGPARAPMAKFYALLDGTKRQPLSDDLVGRMYRQLDEARGLTTAGSIRARLDDLALYTRYVELYLDYSSASGLERQSAFEELLRFTWRIRGTGMVHAKGLWQDLAKRDKAVTVPELAKYNASDATNPWKSDQPYIAEEIAAFIRDGIANCRLLDFEPVAFSNRLVPATALRLPPVPKGSAGSYLRGVRDFWIWADGAPATIPFTGKAGLVYPDRGTARVELYPVAEAELKSVAHLEIKPDKAAHALELATNFPGLHRVEVSDGAQGTFIDWPDGTPMTILSSQEQPAKFYGAWHLYFYVPRGTKVLGGFSEGEGVLLDPGQAVAHRFAARPGYFSIPVPRGQDGRLWSFKTTNGNRTLMTVPPSLARNASELLLPEEVVQKDSRR
ncbi:MAG: DUF4838 domain-containing protein [Opitutaceae bacterium]|nr:DUF4838 domain-containing protein [Opitutaceae bacterium]